MASVQLLSLPPESWYNAGPPHRTKNSLHRPSAEQYLALGFFHFARGEQQAAVVWCGVVWGGGEAHTSVSMAQRRIWKRLLGS